MSEPMPSKLCSKCGLDKPLDDFPLDPRMRLGRTSACRSCHNESSRNYRQVNLERLRVYDRERNMQRWNGDAEYRGRRTDQQRERDDALRARIFAHYGTSCACCGATEDLCIDHVNGGGKEHRIGLFGRNNVSLQLYRWLIEQGFPEGYQTLCRPCNTSKGAGECCRLDHVRT